MDVNCSGYAGPQPGVAAHFFCPVPGSTGNNQNNCSGLTGTSRAAPVNLASGRASGFGVGVSCRCQLYWPSFLSRAHAPALPINN